MISIVVPCYNEQESAPLFYEKATEVLKTMNTEYEIIFVDDGSKDKTLPVLKILASKDKKVKYLSFSRNFGKESAILAGLRAAKGELTAVMDADLQDPPDLLPDMRDAIENEGYDTIATRRVTRKGEPVIRSFFARQFYKIINRSSDVEVIDGARDFRMMNRAVVDAILELKEYNRFSKGIYGWIGFKTKWLTYENIERVAGTTKWSFGKLFYYAIDGIVGFSTAPLRLAAFAGIIVSFIAFCFLLFVIIRAIVFGDDTKGWASTVSIILFSSGLQFLFIGILGEYLGKTYMETKKRPLYFVRETNIDEI